MTARPPQLDVLLEDNHLLVVNKPAGVPTQGAEVGTESMVDIAKQYIADKYHKPGNVYLGVVSRLDAMTTGVLVLARTSKAAARLSAAFRTRAVSKQYLALVEGSLALRADTLETWMLKDESQHRMREVPAGSRDSQQARLSYRRLGVQGDISLVRVALETGRKHQIRVQMAGIGHPVVGDRKYDARRNFPAGVALHAWRLTIPHPIGGKSISIDAPLPPYWPGWAVDAVAREAN